MFDYLRDPQEITRRSFECLRAECDLSAIPEALEPVALRLVHACAMPEILADLAWDGKPAVGAGGTASLVEHWQSRGLTLEHIDLGIGNAVEKLLARHR